MHKLGWIKLIVACNKDDITKAVRFKIHGKPQRRNKTTDKVTKKKDKI